MLTAAGRVQVFAMYLSIVLCFLFALANTRKSNALRTAALACTVGADWFLVVCSPAQQLWGMIFFLGTQTLYALYLYRRGKRKDLVFARVFLIAAIELTAWLVLGSKMDPLAAVSVCYYAILSVNIIDAFTQTKKDLLFPIGLLLFLLCDTVVGLQVAAGSYLSIPDWLHRLLFPGFNLAWVFYMPSQVLIALSQRKRR